MAVKQTGKKTRNLKDLCLVSFAPTSFGETTVKNTIALHLTAAHPIQPTGRLQLLVPGFRSCLNTKGLLSRTRMSDFDFCIG